MISYMSKFLITNMISFSRYNMEKILKFRINTYFAVNYILRNKESFYFLFFLNIVSQVYRIQMCFDSI